MSDESLLSRAVIAEPDDVQIRLMFADWYEERGDPRSDFIRLQVALAQSPDPHPWRREFEQRTKELLRRFGRRWNGPIFRRLNQTVLKGNVHRRRAPVRGWTYRRGFIEVIQVETEAFLRHADLLFELGPVREVRLFRVRPFLHQLAQSSHLRRLRTVDLRETQLTASDLTVLLQSPHLTELRSLDLSQNHLRDEGAMILAESEALPNLEQLYLGGERLREESVMKLRARFGLGAHVYDPERGREGRKPHRYLPFDDHFIYEDGKVLADGVEAEERNPLHDRNAWDAVDDFEELVFRNEWDDMDHDADRRRRPDEEPIDNDDDLWNEDIYYDD